MQVIIPHNHFDKDHLAEVKNDMQKLGAPTIKAVWMEAYGSWVALEGTHRLMAAQELGLTPEIEEIEWSDTVMTDDVVPGSFAENWTIEQICDDAHSNNILDW